MPWIICKIESSVKRGRLVYSKQSLEEIKEAVSENINGVQPSGLALKRLMVTHGFQNNPITRAERELPGIRGCIDALAEGKESAEITNAAWGHTITAPRGHAGKKGYGVDHMQEKRMLHGFTPDEAAFITVCAMKAAESVAEPIKQGNALWFEKFGVRAVVSNNDSQRGLLLTGYVWGTQGKNKAVDREAATLAEHFYALDDLSRNRQVGAALKRAYARFETISSSKIRVRGNRPSSTRLPSCA